MSIATETAALRTGEECAALRYDPLAWVMWAYPWGKAGAILYKEQGPDVWQLDVLDYFGQQLRIQADAHEAAREAIQIAVASGHGPGKTALIVWILMFFISTRAHPQIVVTANTKTQLTTKTWRELAKWHNLFKLKHLFDWTATRYIAKWDPANWFASAIPWSKNSSEAFAGTHEDDVLVLFDEGSGIDDSIWEVVEGAMTTGRCTWIVFGNPTKNSGRFRECWRKLKKRWGTYQVDSRDAKRTNKVVLNRLVEDYGEDADIVRVRVRGLFPRRGANQLIDDFIVEGAQARTPGGWEDMPLVMGVDVARYGDDKSVIYLRQGTATREVKKYRQMDTMTLADAVATTIDVRKPDQVFIDVVGVGSGVVDRLIQLGYGGIVMGCNVADESNDPTLKNKRIEIWGKMRTWLKNGGAIDSTDPEIFSALTAPEYYFDTKDRMFLESKEDMKDRGLVSPDIADALALTFFHPVHATRRPSVIQELILQQEASGSFMVH